MYYLYHIKGVKWGMTKRTVKVRVREQGYTLDDVSEIIEELDMDTASDLENKWNIRDGYKTDFVKYNQGKYTEAGQKGGSKNTDEQQIARSKVGSVYGKIMGLNSVASGHLKRVSDISRRNGSLEKARLAASIKASIPIIAINIESKIETKYNSGSEAANIIGVSKSNIYNILKGKRKTIKGHTFRYA
jgi:hypothetical protein